LLWFFLFTDEDINEDALYQLNESLVSQLVPKVGMRARFLGKLAAMKSEVCIDSSVTRAQVTPTSVRSIRKEKLQSLMLNCFRCEKLFVGWHAFSLHFKVYHNLTACSNFVCAQGGCQRDFQSLERFRRHILAQHGSLSSSDRLSDVNSNDEQSVNFVDANIVNSDDNDVDMDDNVDISSLFDDNGVCLSAASFIAKLKSHLSIPASAVDEILSDVQEFFSSEVIRLLKIKTLAVFNDQKVDIDSDSVQSLLTDFNRLSDLFNGLKSEYQQLKYFKNSGHYIAPETIVVGHRLESQIQNGKTAVVPVIATGQHVPLRKTFEAFFQLPGVLQKAKAYMLKKQTLLNDFVDGSLWQNKNLNKYEMHI
jgi:hypothetical protein